MDQMAGIAGWAPRARSAVNTRSFVPCSRVRVRCAVLDGEVRNAANLAEWPRTPARNAAGFSANAAHHHPPALGPATYMIPATMRVSARSHVEEFSCLSAAFHVGSSVATQCATPAGWANQQFQAEPKPVPATRPIRFSESSSSSLLQGSKRLRVSKDLERLSFNSVGAHRLSASRTSSANPSARPNVKARLVRSDHDRLVPRGTFEMPAR